MEFGKQGLGACHLAERMRTFCSMGVRFYTGGGSIVLGMGFSPYPSVANAGITNYFPIHQSIKHQVRAWQSQISIREKGTSGGFP